MTTIIIPSSHVPLKKLEVFGDIKTIRKINQIYLEAYLG
jgi:hypothetical protein